MKKYKAQVFGLLKVAQQQHQRSQFLLSSALGLWKDAENTPSKSKMKRPKTPKKALKTPKKKRVSQGSCLNSEESAYLPSDEESDLDWENVLFALNDAKDSLVSDNDNS